MRCLRRSDNGNSEASRGLGFYFGIELLQISFPVFRRKELPPWFFERHNFTRRRLGLLCVALMSQTFLPCSRAAAPPLLMEGVDLFSLDGERAILCRAGNSSGKDVKRFLRTAHCVLEAGETCTSKR